MFSIQNLSKSHGARTLFVDASMVFNEGSRYGIVGANGSGKSTLLRIIAGDEEATTGTVAIPKRAHVAVLRQDHFHLEDVSILNVVMMGNPILWAAMEEKEALLANAENHFDADKYSELEDIVVAHDGYTMEARAAEVLEGLNIPTAVHDEPLSVLSGGFKLRVLLAQALASNPDILLLDEPTNHLDIVSIAWLESFLAEYKGCSLVVSHDHQFLDRVCTHIVDVDYERVLVYPGNYTAFEESKVEDRDRAEAEIAKREKEIHDHKVFITRFKAKASKARQAQSRVKRMAKITIEKLPMSSRQFPMFRFKQVRPSGKQVLDIEGVCKAFDDNVVLDDVTLSVQRGDRIAVIGPNGIGKSTLLKIAVDAIKADAGTAEWGHEVRVGYFSQDHEELRGHETSNLIDYIWNFVPNQGVGFVRGKLAEVLFSRDDVEKRVEALSGGEAARLMFCRLGVQQPNVLVLDEPTNHLDLEGISALADGLCDFDGTTILVSHDRWFVSKVATRVLEISPEGVTNYPGSYQEYVARNTDHLDTSVAMAEAKASKQKKNGKKKGGKGKK